MIVEYLSHLKINSGKKVKMMILQQAEMDELNIKYTCIKNTFMA